MTMPAIAESRFLKFALRYAELGWFVFPLGVRSKIPLLGEKQGGHGFKDGTRNPEQIRVWWTKYPEANIGLRPGPSGFIAADLDGPACEQLAQEFGLPPTFGCITGRGDGGRHLYYQNPGFIVGNVLLGAGLRAVKESDGVPYILWRGHDGYVVAPPSIHPDTGKEYQWTGKPEEIAALPPEVAAALKAVTTDAPTVAGASSPIAGGKLREGSRNNALTRVAGSLVKQYRAPEATELLWGYNLANCDPPYTRVQCEQIVVNVNKREAKKPSRFTDTGQILTVADAPVPTEMPRPMDLSIQQTMAAVAAGSRDFSNAPRWSCTDLNDMVGPILPADLNVVGGLTGNGKTAIMLSEMDALAAQGIPLVYMGLELDPETLRRKWAAWALGYDWVFVATNAWDKLEPGAKKKHEAKVAEQGQLFHVQFPPDKKITIPGLTRWTKWGIEHVGARVIFIDHIHRMDVGGASDNYRVQLTNAVRMLKDLAREHSVGIIAAAQLNRASDIFDPYEPPGLHRLKESAALAEEADVVLMLSRRLRSGNVSQDDIRAIKSGHTEVRVLEDPNVMVVTCRKHRLIDSARDRHVKLAVLNGHVQSLYQYGAQP